MAVKTKVISTRVPIGVYNDFRALSKVKKVSMSKLITDGITGNAGLHPSTSIDNQTAEKLFSIAGGCTSGILTYKVVKGALEERKPEWTPTKIELAAGAAAVAVAMLVGFGISKLINALSD